MQADVRNIGSNLKGRQVTVQIKDAVRGVVPGEQLIYLWRVPSGVPKFEDAAAITRKKREESSQSIHIELPIWRQLE
jgi:hypothetical protein